MKQSVKCLFLARNYIYQKQEQHQLNTAKKMHKAFQLNQKYRVFAVHIDLQRTYYHANNKQYLCNSQNIIIEEKKLTGADFPYYYKYNDGTKQLSNDIDDYVLIQYYGYLICFVYDKIYHINQADGTVSILYQRNKKLDEKLYNMLKTNDQAKYNSNRFSVVSNYIIENTLDKIQLINQYQLHNLTSFLQVQCKKPYFIVPIYHRQQNKYYYLYDQNNLKSLYIPSINSNVEMIDHIPDINSQHKSRELKHTTILHSITDQTVLLIQNNDISQHEIIKHLQDNFFKYYPLISLELRSTQYQINFQQMDSIIRDKFIQNSLDNVQYILHNIQQLDCYLFLQLFMYYSQEQLMQAITKLLLKKKDIMRCNNATINMLAQLDNKMYETDNSYQFNLLAILMKHSQFYNILQPAKQVYQTKKKYCQITSTIQQPKLHNIKENLYLSVQQYNYIISVADSEDAVQLLCININQMDGDIHERLIMKIDANRIPRLLKKLIECCLRHQNMVNLANLAKLLTKLKIDYCKMENQHNMPFDSSELLASSTLLQFLSTDYDNLDQEQRQQLVNLIIWSINNKMDSEIFNEQISFNYRVIVLSAYMRVLINCFENHLLNKYAEYKPIINYTMSFEELILNQFIQYQYQQDIIEYIFSSFELINYFFTTYSTINSIYNNQQINLGCSLLELIFNQNKNIYLYTSNYKSVFCFQNIILDEQFVANVLNKIKYDDLIRLIQIIPFRAICNYIAKMKNSNMSRRETYELIKTLSIYKDYYGRSYLYYTFHSMTGRLIEAACTYFFNNGISRDQQIEFGYFQQSPDLDCFGRTKQEFGQLLQIATNDNSSGQEDSEYSFRPQAPSLDYREDSYDYSNVDENSFL